MPRFFFPSRDGDALTKDREGMELPDLEAARAEAIVGLRQLAADDLRQNLPASKGRKACACENAR
jgi:hypothetical protein